MIWSILGLSVAIIATFCVVVAEYFVPQDSFQHYKHWVSLGLSGTGVVLWIIARIRSGSTRQSDTVVLLSNPSAEAPDEPAETTFFALRLFYWGPMFVALGIILVFIRPLKTVKAEAPMKQGTSEPKKEVVVPAPPPKPKPRRAVEFPVAKLQGIFFRNASPSAIINGESVYIGDRVGDAEVSHITRDSVSLTIGEETRTLILQ